MTDEQLKAATEAANAARNRRSGRMKKREKQQLTKREQDQ